jgi:Protein of unknown function (DUF4245)
LVDTPPAPSAPTGSPSGRRARQTAWDMLFSLAVLVAIVGVIVALRQPGGRPVHVIDPNPAYSGARSVAQFDVRTPHGLPRGWRATSARTRSDGGHVTLAVGFVTPGGQYAQLVEGDAPRDQLLVRELSAGARPTGSQPVAGRTWERLSGFRPGDRAIARTEGTVTYLVHGSASFHELGVLAAALN